MGTEMESEYKTAELLDLKMDVKEQGSFAAFFAPFEQWDKGGDWTERGAFGRQNVVISSYGHGSSVDGRLPVGKGVIYDGPDGGICEGRFFLNTTIGKETYDTVKELGDLQEWSYYLPSVVSEVGERAGRKGRILKKIKVQEVCPVLRGMGNGTRTLAIKSTDLSNREIEGPTFSERYDSMIHEVRDVVARLKGRVDYRESHGSRPSPKDLKRGRELDAELSELMQTLHESLRINDGIDNAYLTFLSLDSRRRG
jgi:hypothetical protein